MATMQEQIKAHLDSVAVADNVFADRLKNPRKSFDKCIKFINSEAKTYMEQHKDEYSMSGGYGGDIDDPIIFGWAVHYYTEDGLDIDKTEEEKKAEREARNAEIKKKTEESKKATAEAKKKAKKEEKKKAVTEFKPVVTKSATDLLKKPKTTEKKEATLSKKDLKKGNDCFDMFSEFFS